MTWLISVLQLFSNRQTDRNISLSICTGRTFENHTTNWSRRLSLKHQNAASKGAQQIWEVVRAYITSWIYYNKIHFNIFLPI